MRYEKALILATVILAAGALGWIVQALEGARLVPWEGYRHGRQKGDLLGLAAVLGILILVAVVDHAPLARRLGLEARRLYAEGYRVLPLTMVRTAAVLDPGRTDYQVVALKIYEELGDTRRSAGVRERLERDLASYLTMVRDEDRRRARQAAAVEAWLPEEGRDLSLADTPGTAQPWPFLDVKDPEAEASGSR